MPLVTTKDMFAKAYEGGYAIGAFNINNMETIQGIVEAGKLEKAPLILQVSSSARKYANSKYLVKMVQAAVEDSGLPICLHLDHGDSYDLCVDCIKDGFTSVMIDASSHPLAENIKITSQVVKYAHDHGVVVEAELGRLAGVEDNVKVSASTRPRSPSAPATARSSSRAKPSCASIFSKRWRTFFPSSLSSCTARARCFPTT